MSSRDTTFKIDLSEYEPEEREAIAIEIIDHIIRRTRKGVDKDGNRFAPYSKDYRDSANFKIAGKSGKVDLTLSGDMLDSMEIVDNYLNGKVVIGYGPDNPEQGKAEGNVLGTYGQASKVGPERNFLGITEEELDKILDKYPPSTERSERRAKETLSKVKESSRLSGRIELDDLEDED